MTGDRWEISSRVEFGELAEGSDTGVQEQTCTIFAIQQQQQLINPLQFWGPALTAGQSSTPSEAQLTDCTEQAVAVCFLCYFLGVVATSQTET